MAPHPCSGPDRAWLSRCLEVTTESLRELHVMRQEAEDRIRGVLGDHRRAQDVRTRNGTAWRNQDCARAKNPELEHIEEEVCGHRHRRNTITKRRKRSSTSHLPDLDSSLEISPQGPNDSQHGRVSSSPIHALTEELQHKMILREDAEKSREVDQRKTSASRYVLEKDREKFRGSREIQMDLGRVRGSRESLERDHGRVRGSRESLERDLGKVRGSRESLERDQGKIREIQDRDHGKTTKSKVIQDRGSRENQGRGSREFQDRRSREIQERGLREFQERGSREIQERGSRESLERDHGKIREIQDRDHGKTTKSKVIQDRGSREIQERGSRHSLEREHGRARGSRESLERDHEKLREIQDRYHGEATKSIVIQERGSRENQERGSRESLERDHGKIREIQDRDHGKAKVIQEIQQRDHGKATESWQSQMWENEEGSVHRAQKALDQDSLSAIEGTEIFQSTEPYLLRRIGSGSLAPRLRLGSSGVTSDLLFTRRFSGNCLSTHSSGFYENSDLDSISSSCSSLCSDSSCYSSFSMISPHRTSVMRPRSIDYTNERRKELQNGRAQPRRPISAGALEGFSFSPISTSRFDITQSNDRTTCDYTYSTPPHCAIQQRRKAERYICKLALKYRCKPGVSNPLPDLGPPTPRTPAPAPLYSECDDSCPPSPQINSLSSSLGDVSKTPKGSWGRFFSRVVLKKDSRIAASELNLQHCVYSPQKNLRSPSLADGQLVRAKSFRDLLSVKPFKKSQKALNKLW